MIIYDRDWFRRKSGNWFAWYPVRIQGSRKIVWLETVFRKRNSNRFIIWMEHFRIEKEKS